MTIYGDFHTHTKYSHGKGTVEENVKEAALKGLKSIAITDHGLSHIVFGLRRKKIEKLKKDIENIKDKYDINILMGVEANITGLSGKIDLKPSDYDMFDVVLMGFHKCVYPDSAKDFFKFFFKNYFNKNSASNSTLRDNTNAFVNAIKNNKVDVLTHINHHIMVDCKEIAKVCADYGTLLEINSKRISYSDEQFMEMYDTGVNFIVNSDAHVPCKVGNFEIATDFIKRFNIPVSRIANADKLPKFRSKV